MKQNARDQLQVRLLRAAAAAAAAAAVFSFGTVAAGTVHEAMLLHETVDGRPLLCVSPLGNQAELVRFRQRQEDAVLGAPPALDFGAIDTVLSYELNRLFDVKQVRAQMTRSDTGSTFMRGEDGSYVIRRPAVEWIYQVMVIPPQ
jgi:hypothetical protein